MNLKTILVPGHFLARRADKNYEKLSRSDIKKKSWWSRNYIGLIELFVFIFIGAAMALVYKIGVLALWHVIVIILAFYLGGAIMDSDVWRLKIMYGKLAKGVGYKASFLMNLDRIYHFLIGFVLGMVLIFIF